MKKSQLLTILIIFAVAFWIGSNFKDTEKAQAVAGQLNAKLATSSTITVSTVARTVFATSTCTTRVVTTNADPVRFYFGDITGFSLTSAVGHTQAASTTSTYDGSVYGCGQWTVINAGPQGNTAIFQVSEF